ncbi:MAG TPA: CcdB family protein [Rhizomicrobium sp.]|jgi:toxin CcdB
MAKTRSTIRQFDVVPNPIAALRRTRPCLLCVQHRIPDSLDSRLMATLTAEKIDQSLPRLHPKFEIAGQLLYLLPQDLLTLPLRILRNPIANLSDDSHRIIAALDLVFTGL